MPDRPYRFLDFYEKEDSGIFFGRDRETRVLLSDVVVNRLVVLFARTGTGKTSLINAGVRPRLEDQGFVTFLVRVNQDPSESARVELIRQVGSLKGERLAEQLGNVAKQLGRPIVLFFDQFEEFFLYVEDKNPRKAADFIEDVARLYHDETSGVRIVFSMREEFFVEMDAFRDRIPIIFHNDSNLRLSWFDEGQAREAITQPARVFGTKVNPDVVDQLVADLMDRPEGIGGRSVRGAIEPAKLQIVCDTLWDKRVDGVITLEHYRALGRPTSELNIAQQVLYRRFEDGFEKVKSQEQLKLLEQLLPELRTDHKTKYVRDVEGLAKALQLDPRALGLPPTELRANLDDLLSTLESIQFIRRSLRDNLPTIELAHDYLVQYLDSLRARVAAIWPRRKLGEAFAGFLSSGEYAAGKELHAISDELRAFMERVRNKLQELTSRTIPTPEDVKRLWEDADYLKLDQAQVEFLFRSELASGSKERLWFDEALRRGADVWQVLRDEIQSKNLAKASDAIDFLADLLGDPESSEADRRAASQLLEGSLQWEDIGPHTVEALRMVETEFAVKLLGKALMIPPLAAQAESALQRLGGLKGKRKGDVAAEANQVLRRYDQAMPDLRTRSALRGTEPTGLRTLDQGITGEALRIHCALLMKRILEGRVVPFLGAGVNLCDRPKNFEWKGSEQTYLPSGSELARELAHYFDYPGVELDLARISQYGDLTQGMGELYERLHSLFAREYPPTRVHEFLAALPPAEPERRRPENRNLLIVTINYDDLMERALAAVRPCDVVFYDPDDKPARFWHKKPDGTTLKIVDPNRHGYSFFDERPVVLKIHGTVDRSNQGREGYVITEDHYIEYLAEEALEKLLPNEFLTKLRSNHLLFLGYSLRDWNLRVFLRRLKRSPKQAYKAWAVLPYADLVEEQFWWRREVETVKVPLETYIDGLEKELTARKVQPAVAPGGGSDV